MPFLFASFHNSNSHNCIPEVDFIIEKVVKLQLPIMSSMKSFNPKTFIL